MSGPARVPVACAALASVVAMVFVVGDVPSPRSGFGLVYDAGSERVVLFGGGGPFGDDFRRLGDTWSWRGEGWAEHDGAEPSGRSDFVMAYDAARDRIVVFGGVVDGQRSDETLEFDGERWTVVAATGPTPPARALAAMAYDPVRERAVLYGGVGPDGERLGDTWEFDGARWTRLPGEGPSPRGAHAMAYHGSRRTMVLHGGYADATLSDTWEFDGAGWRRMVGEGPPRLHMALAYDAARDRLVLYGGFGVERREGDTWERDAEGWRRVAGEEDGPGPRAEHEGVYVPGQGLLVFGGIVGQGMAHEERVKVADTWIWDGTEWREFVAGRAGGFTTRARAR